MIIQKDVLQAVILFAKHVASGDPTRHSLNFVQIDVTDTEYRLEATDRHRLVRKSIAKDTGCESHPEPGRYGMHFDRVKLAQAFIKDTDKHSNQMLVPGVLVTGLDLPAFPNTKQLDSLVDSDSVTISFNAQYLQEMMLAMRDSKSETVTLKVPKTTDKAIVVECCGSNGLLMPVRLNKK